MAEKLAREQAERDGLNKSTNGSFAKRTGGSMGATAKSTTSKNTESRAHEHIQAKMQEISSFSGDPPEPEILMQILKGKRT